MSFTTSQAIQYLHCDMGLSPAQQTGNKQCAFADGELTSTAKSSLNFYRASARV